MEARREFVMQLGMYSVKNRPSCIDPLCACVPDMSV